MGWRQFLESKCACVKKRKASECACIKCTFVSHNLGLVHAARRGWHRAKVQRVGGAPCVCHIHPRVGAAEGAAEIADELHAQAEGWRAAAEEGDAEAAARAEMAQEAAEAARVEAMVASAKLDKARKYDSMTKSVESLTAALMPCGKVSFPRYSIIGAGEFRAYKKQCVFNNCEKAIFRPSEACGWDRVFGPICPTEATDDPFSWFTWEKRLRGVSDEGKEFYSLEWVPKHGTRKEFWDDLQHAVKENIPHRWREHVMRQGRRVFEDRKSGHHLDALRERQAVLAAKAVGPRVFAIFVHWAESSKFKDPLGPTERWLREERPASLRALLRAATHEDTYLQLQYAERALPMAEKVYKALSTTATIQSDYASQLETSRTYHATCATKERHNYLVSLMGYKSSRHTRCRPRTHRPPRRASGMYVDGRAKLMPSTSPSRSQQINDERVTHEYSQRVDVLFAFHKAGYKPSARSYNVVMEDVCHFLKYGTVLHGEWFIEGARVPGGDHRNPLPNGLSERPQMTPDFCEMLRMQAVTDGCPNQFDYGTNYHQTAEWRTKTAAWALEHAKNEVAAKEVERAAAKAAFDMIKARADLGVNSKAIQESRFLLEETTKAVTAALARTVEVRDTDGLAGAIIRSHTKLIEYHGKGGYDAEGNVPKFAVANAITTNAMVDPDTRNVVLFLAKNRPRPSVGKANKSGWEAPGRYIWAYYDTKHFTKFIVPDATSTKGCQEQHEFVGLCKDRMQAEQVGVHQSRLLFCACDPCLLYDFEHCEMQSVVGKMSRVKAPLPRGAQTRQPKLLALREFADSLECNQVVAVNADSDERHLEGSYWLAQLTGPAFVIPEDCVHSGQQYYEGWIVAPGHWYVLRQQSERGYELQSAEVWIVVNHMVRLRGISFTSSQSGPQGRTLRKLLAKGPASSGRAMGTGLSFLSEDMHNQIMLACGGVED